MRNLAWWRIGLLALLVSACSLTPESEPAAPHPSPIVRSTETPPSAEDTAVAPAQVSDLSPYGDATYLLDGICFAALDALNGQSWVWGSTADLDAFYDQLDDASLCPALVTRVSFDFAQGVLVGTTTSATGCDAAYRAAELAQDDAARRQVLHLTLQIATGCPYELVEPVVAIVPPPPEGFALAIAISAGP